MEPGSALTYMAVQWNAERTWSQAVKSREMGARQCYLIVYPSHTLRAVQWNVHVHVERTWSQAVP